MIKNNILASIKHNTTPPAPVPVTDAGIYHDAINGLISLSLDGENRTTVADKNLGATTVYNSGDTLSQNNCGSYYQRGNNYGFPFSGEILTSNIQVDATDYGPGNYYSSDTFITRSEDWSSVTNDNLWGNVTGTIEAEQGPCNTGYHVPSKSDSETLINAMTTLGIDTSNGLCMMTYLKLPLAGLRNYMRGDVESDGVYGEYWCCNSSYVFFSDGVLRISDGGYRARAFPIRPFKNVPVTPDTSRTVLYQPIAER